MSQGIRIVPKWGKLIVQKCVRSWRGPGDVGVKWVDAKADDVHEIVEIFEVSKPSQVINALAISDKIMEGAKKSPLIIWHGMTGTSTQVVTILELERILQEMIRDIQECEA